MVQTHPANHILAKSRNRAARARAFKESKRFIEENDLNERAADALRSIPTVIQKQAGRA